MSNHFQCPNVCCCVAFLIDFLGAACYCPCIPVFLQGTLTCWHMRLKYILHNPIFLANTIVCLILYETAKTCFVSVVCKITFRRFHGTRWYLKGIKKTCFSSCDRLQVFGWRQYHAFFFVMCYMLVANICPPAELV